MKIELRDPNKLRLHKLHSHLPKPDETTPEWYSFSDNLQANGPAKCPAIVITDQGFVMDGWRRVLVARARQWEHIRCEIRDEAEAALIIVESLFGHRDMSRGAKVYFTTPLRQDTADGAEKRRLSNLLQNRETNEKAQCLPNTSNLCGPKEWEWFCNYYGVSYETIRQSNEVWGLLHDSKAESVAELARLKPQSKEALALQSDLRAEFEPQLASGEKNLWNVHSAIGGRFATKDKERNVVQAAQLEFWQGHLHPLIGESRNWKKLPQELRQRVKHDVITLVQKMTQEDQADVAEALSTQKSA